MYLQLHGNAENKESGQGKCTKGNVQGKWTRKKSIASMWRGHIHLIDFFLVRTARATELIEPEPRIVTIGDDWKEDQKQKKNQNQD